MAIAERACVKPVQLVAQALRGTDEIVAVTGATGWFGAVALDLLYEALGEQAPARVVGYASGKAQVVVVDQRTVHVRPLTELPSQDPRPTILLHFAFLTRDRIAALGVDRYTSQNIAITATVLAAIARHKPKGVVVLSSGAARPPQEGQAFDLGTDPYGTLKYLDELAFRAATRDAGGTCVIPRVFSAAGFRMTKPGLYALGAMIAMARLGGPIKVAARGPVFRSYCGVHEVVALALWVALAGRDAVFDTSGTVVEMGELAQLVAQHYLLDAGAVKRTWDPAAVAESYVGDGRLMDAFAADACLALSSLPTLIRDTSNWLSLVEPQGGLI